MKIKSPFILLGIVLLLMALYLSVSIKYECDCIHLEGIIEQAKEDHRRSQDEYQIYTLLIEDMVNNIRRDNNENKKGTIIVDKRTDLGIHFSSIEVRNRFEMTNKFREYGKSIDISDETLFDYINSGLNRTDIRNRFTFNEINNNVKIWIYSKEELASTFGDSFWLNYYMKYPNGLGKIEFSRVGFNKDFNTGMVYMGHQWHYLAGKGEIFKVQKNDGKWGIVKRKVIWIS